MTRTEVEIFCIGFGFGWVANWIATWLWVAWKDVRRIEANASATLPGHVVTRIDDKVLELRRRKP